MRALPPQTVFSRAEARAAGWSDSALSRAMRAGRLAQPRRGFFTVPEAAGERSAAIAAVTARAGTVLCDGSALLMHDLPILDARPLVPDLTVAPRGAANVPGVHLHRATLAPDDIVLIDGVPVTSVARTVIDVARGRSTAAAVVAIDAALNRATVTIAELEEITRRCWNWPGIRRARRALRLSDGRAESPLESVSRLVIRSLRLPVPDLQPLALDRLGYPAGRLDFYWDEWGVAGEADGRSKYDDREVLTAEKDRQEKLENHSLVFVRWGWNQVRYQPQLLRSRLTDGFERGAARDRSGFPRLWSICRAKPVGTEENVIR